MPNAQTAEHGRLAEATGRAEDDLFNANPWYEWGPYLSERAWGTVREDYSESGDAWDSFPHDHARSRAYRWNEDGMAGISDIRHELCLALALWNGNDPILKERMFGLTGPQGNHGEDVKEYWWYLEGLPSHALLRWRYHYPQAAFPYEQLVEPRPRAARPGAGAARHGRVRRRPVLVGRRHLREGLADRGADADRAREPRPGRGDARRAADAVVPQHVVVRRRGARDRGSRATATGLTVADHRLAGYRLEAAPGPDGAAPEALFCENETNAPRVFGAEATTPYPKDGINDHVVSGRRDGQSRGLRDEGRAALPRDRGGRRQGRAAAAAARARDGTARPTGPATHSPRSSPRASRTPTSSTPRSRRTGPRPSRCRSCGRRAPASSGASRCIRTTWPAGWTATRASRRRRRRTATAATRGWRHLDAFDVLAMPDPWEYPWFAAWDLGFHCVPWAHLDPAFAKYQLIVLLREWFQHPNGALPAYEWNFDDVNPPVHVMAAIRVFLIDGGTDREFLERVFQKLLINFTWWLNREDADGNNVFSGGFLGLDNISPVDRSNLPEGVSLEQADGTAWMAYYALSMLVIALVLAEENDVYWDMVIKFLEQFVLVARALERQGLYDAEDAFFYDRLVYPSGESTQVKVKTISGLLPVLPAVPLSARVVQAAERLGKRFARLRDAWAETGGTLGVGRVRGDGDEQAVLLSVIDPDELRKTLAAFFDEAEFLSPHGLRAVSKRYEGNPYTLDGVPGAWIDYEPAESTTSMFGGNSNWRGPIWMPLNYLAIRQFVIYHHFFGDDFKLEYPTGSGEERTFGQIAQDLADRIISIWLPGPDGRRPLYGGVERLQTDPAWKDNLFFNEYFHGDNGAGLGATHQTGWTALVADLILDPPSTGLSLGGHGIVSPA